MTGQPECWDCEWHGLNHPCRRNGALDIETLALAYHRDVVAAGEDLPEDLPWSWGCVNHLAETSPDLCLDIVVACLRHISSAHQASVLAAGPLEDVIADHGLAVMARVETLARQSVRFRYLLSGVWPRGQDREGAVWQRVIAACAPGPSMDRGDALPLDA